VCSSRTTCVALCYPLRVPRTDPLQHAKQRALDALEGEPWFMGLGITRKDAKRALLVSVRKSARDRVERVLGRLDLRVPVVVREVERVRALPGRKKGSRLEAAEVEALKEAARRRS
jgi:hypothetical protein